MEVICINDSNKPKEIPSDCWIKEGEIYNVVQILRMERQKGIFGFVLAEISLPENCPFDSFDSRRFALRDKNKSFADEIEEWLNEENLVLNEN